MSVISGGKNRSGSADKVRRYRARMRARGLRSIQLWVPDTRAPGFADEARRQARAVACSAREREDQAFIDAISVPDEQ